jgi:hypothetical protein
MCLKQNPKIKRWKEATIQQGVWQDYREPSVSLKLRQPPVEKLS